ncbi:MAG TPA: isochorismatase family protein [Nocardioidaceae bacterium]|nr:isochorismatase family protein [Nocardioidaceae bacterium]
MTVDDGWAANQSAGLGERLRRGTRPCVVVVDLANAFTRPSHALGGDLSQVVESTSAVLANARRSGLPVIYTTIAFRPDLSDIGIWVQKAPLLAELVTGTELVGIDERLQRHPDEPVVEKQGTSAFFGTELIAMLVSRKVDTVILCGASTSGCVRATAVDCLQYGLPALIPRECVGDRSTAAHEASLRDLDAKYADVVSLREVLDYVEGQSEPVLLGRDAVGEGRRDG